MSSAPYREVRATYDAKTITVYQAYNTAIAQAAVETQRLSASPEFHPGRMTWIKPSWAWMMYRSGYSYKDPGQACILALKMKHEHFLGLLERGVLTSHTIAASEDNQKKTRTGLREKSADVRIQWDPERSLKMAVLPHRSIQIGIPGALSGTWASEWIVEIEDVTEKAMDLKKTLDERPDITIVELVEMGLVPPERPFPLSGAIRSRLEMNDVVSRTT